MANKRHSVGEARVMPSHDSLPSAEINPEVILVMDAEMFN